MSIRRAKSTVFYSGLGLLFTHELDAMPNHEWRVLPVLRGLSEEIGMQVFLLAHVPIFAVVIALAASLNRRTRYIAQIALSIFVVVHAVLHTLFSGDVYYEFSSLTSGSLIYGAAACGAAYLILDGIGRRRGAA